jgi:formate dehydrogenase major subunit
MDDVRKEVAKWTPDKVEDVTGVPEASVRMAPKCWPRTGRASVVWCMGITQHHVGTANVRALSILQLALGNIGVRAAAPTSTAATTTCRARPTSARTAIRCPATTAWPKAPGSTSPTSGASTTTGCKGALRLEGADGKARHHGVALVRRVLEENQYVDQPSNLRACSTGATRRTARPACRHEGGHAKARPAGGGRSVSEHDGGDARPHATASTCCRPPRSSRRRAR